MTSSERIIIAAPSEQKTMALLFDKVWFPRTAGLEKPDHCYSEYYLVPPSKEIMFFTEKEILEYQNFILSVGSVGKGEWRCGEEYFLFLNKNLRVLANLYRSLGYEVFHTYRFYELWNLRERNAESSNLLYEVAIDKIAIIDESRLSWDQVMEFREDNDSIKKLRNFKLWVEEAISVASKEQASDLLEQKLEDYRLGNKKAWNYYGSWSDETSPRLPYDSIWSSCWNWPSVCRQQ
ncbi:MAG: hypothetical protein AABY47_06965 [Pseudomonadota bacterium]